MEADMVHRALGNEIRQRMLVFLAEKDAYLSEIAEKLRIAPQTADFHLGLLTEIGLLSYEWKGGKKYYHLKDKQILEFLRERKPIPLGFHPKPPHEIVMDAWDDLSKRLDAIDKKIDGLSRKVDKLSRSSKND